MKSAAVGYARRGWWVFPLYEMREGVCSCGQMCSSPGKHPRTTRGVHDASNDPTVVESWWDRWPDANIGLATGRGVVVVDLDVRPGKDGVESWDRLDIAVDNTLVCETGGGGFHLYFSTLGKVGNSVGKLGSGIDVRGDGGYVILPPSNHASGGVYAWMEEGAPFAELPEALEKRMRAAKRRAPAGPNEPVTKLGSGERNDGLTSLAGAMRQSGLGLEAMIPALLAENQRRCIPPLPDDEVTRIAESVARYEPGGGFDFTEHGNAERMMREFGPRMRFICTWQKWMVWDERRWRLAGADSKLNRFAKLTVAEMKREAAELAADDDDLGKALKKWARASRKRSMYANMVALCQSEPGVPVYDDRLDRSPMVFNCANGTLNLRTGELQDHNRSDLLTQLSGIEWDEDAECPTWERFVLEVCGGDVELYRWLQRAVGYSLTGRTDEHVLFFCYGRGANGKSTFLETVLKLFGEYGLTGAPGLLQATQSGHPTQQAALHLKRLVVCQEIEEGAPWNEPVVKYLTGGDTIAVRRMHENFWQLTPTHTIWVTGNARPVVKESTDGIWRRMKLIPFTVSFKGREDPALPRKLGAELPGILRWAVQGCLDWQSNGLGQAQAVIEASARYREDMDILGGWTAECLDVYDPKRIDLRLSRMDIAKSYQRWCMHTGERALSNRRLYRELENRGYQPYRTGTQRGFKGLALRAGQDGLHIVK